MSGWTILYRKTNQTQHFRLGVSKSEDSRMDFDIENGEEIFLITVQKARGQKAAKSILLKKQLKRSLTRSSIQL